MKFSTTLAPALASLSTATAFVAPSGFTGAVGAATSQRRSSSTCALRMAQNDYAASLPGAPFGMAAEGKYFDPAGLAAEQDFETIKKWREAELKHGRVSMLAAVGILLSEVFHPFFMGPVYIGPAVEHAQQIATVYPLFWVASLGLIAFIEGQTIKDAWGTVSPVTGVGNMKEEHYPGDLGFDPLGLAPKDGEQFRLIQSQELEIGRYAMIGVAGMIAQECVDGQGILEHVISRV